jgi:predicted transcriptional regulator
MLKEFAKNFRLGRKGLGRTFGDIERAIMDLLWSRSRITGKEVFKSLSQEREIALTTVLTVLERLVKKGLVNKKKGDIAYLFSPACTRDEFTEGVSQEVLKGVFEISGGSATASFVDILADTDPDELDRLSLLIKQKKEELEKKNREI